jgi:ER membrane protein complex subunit 4
MSVSQQQQMAPPPPPPQWAIDLNNPIPAKPKNVASIPDPPGYSSTKSLSGKQVSAN